MIGALLSRAVRTTPPQAAYRTAEEYRRRQAGLGPAPELTQREATLLDLELDDLAALTAVHGPWKAARLMWGTR